MVAASMPTWSAAALSVSDAVGSPAASASIAADIVLTCMASASVTAAAGRLPALICSKNAPASTVYVASSAWAAAAAAVSPDFTATA